MFGAFRDAANSITVEPDYGGSPSLVFIQNNILRGRLNTLLGSLELYGNGSLDIGSSGPIFIKSSRVEFGDWESIYNATRRRTLADELNDILIRLEILEDAH
ncbi:hypothetical protein D3C74_383080 [compost metagenome]